MLLLVLSSAGMALAQDRIPDAARDSGEVEITARELADRLIEYAETFLGTPYRYGANGPKRFDCTGYTRYVYGHFGYHNLSRSAKDQARDGREVDISDFHNLQKGDILAIGSRRNPKVVGQYGQGSAFHPRIRPRCPLQLDADGKLLRQPHPGSPPHSA